MFDLIGIYDLNNSASGNAHQKCLVSIQTKFPKQTKNCQTINHDRLVLFGSNIDSHSEGDHTLYFCGEIYNLNELENRIGRGRR